MRRMRIGRRGRRGISWRGYGFGLRDGDGGERICVYEHGMEMNLGGLKWFWRLSWRYTHIVMLNVYIESKDHVISFNFLCPV